MPVADLLKQHGAKSFAKPKAACANKKQETDARKQQPQTDSR